MIIAVNIILALAVLTVPVVLIGRAIFHERSIHGPQGVKNARVRIARTHHETPRAYRTISASRA